MHTKSASFFEAHKSVNEFYHTVDGQHFYTEGAAAAHALDLKRAGEDDTVTKVTREEVAAAGAGGNTGNTGNDLTPTQKGQVTKLKKKLAEQQAIVDGLAADAADDVRSAAVADVDATKSAILAIDATALDATAA